MRTIRVFVSVSEGLGEVETAVRDLLVHLNKHFKPRGVEFLPAPRGAGPIDGDLALALYWKGFGDLPKADFEKAYESFKATKVPKIYVFFKEPDDDITEALKAFRDSFAEKYGHFYCHFETVDSVKFQLTVQSLSLLPEAVAKNELSVENGEVRLGNESIAKLDSLSFAKLNATRRNLQRQFAAQEKEVSDLEAEASANPEDEELRDVLRQARVKRHDLEEELRQYDGFLFSTALFFARESGKEMDERVRQARDLFECGRAAEANRILDLPKLVEQANRNLELFRANRDACEKDIQTFVTKAEVAMGDGTISIGERRLQAYKAYSQAVRIAREIGIDRRQLAKLLFDSAVVCQSLMRFDDAERLLNEELSVLNGDLNTEIVDRDLLSASAWTLLSDVYDEQNRLQDAINAAKSAIVLLRARIGGLSSDACFPYKDMLSVSLHDLANYFRKTGQSSDAEPLLREAIHIRRKLMEQKEESSLAVVESLTELGGVLYDLGKLEEAEHSIHEALTMLQSSSWFHSDAGQERKSSILGSLALVHAQLRRTNEAVSEFEDAIQILHLFLKRNPGIQLEKLPMYLIDLGIVFSEEAAGPCEESFEAFRKADEVLNQMAPTPKRDFEQVRLNIHLAQLLAMNSNSDEARKRIEEAVQTSKSLARGSPTNIRYRRLAIVSIVVSGFIRTESGSRRDIRSAEQLFRDAISAIHGYDDADAIFADLKFDAMVGLASVLIKLGNESESERMAKQCCDSLMQHVGSGPMFAPTRIKDLLVLLNEMQNHRRPAWIESVWNRLQEHALGTPLMAANRFYEAPAIV